MFRKSTELFDIARLEHDARDNEGHLLDGYIQTHGESLYYLYEQNNPNPIGYVDFDIIIQKGKHIIVINGMENYNCSLAMGHYKGIGALLHEFVIYKASQLRQIDAIQLVVAYHSHVFHYRCGFRFKKSEDNQRLESYLINEQDKINSLTLPQSMILSETTLQLKIEKYQTPLHEPKSGI